MTDEAEWLARAAERFRPVADPRRPSALRLYMREHFDALMGVKARRGLSWPQVAELLSARGLAKADGSALDGNAVAVMAAQIRWERDPKSRRRRRRGNVSRPKPAAAAPPGSETAPVPAPPPDAPPPNPFAEFDRRREETRERAERAARQAARALGDTADEGQR